MRLALIAAMAVFATALYGWGWAFRKLFRMEEGAWAATLALGLAVILFLGGLLNLARIAYAPLLAALVLAGLILAFNAWYLRFGYFGTKGASAIPHDRLRLLAVAVPIILILGFVIVTALPPAAYNTADDYGKYFFHPVRMLAYGTLYGSPLSDLGSETLGGKAFIDGFVAALFPLNDLNATDGVFGLFLCLVLVAGMAGSTRLAGALAVLAVFAIDPQWINISALYLGAALMAAAIALTANTKERISPAALGLVYAGLIALKTSFALFAVLHAVAVTVALAWHEKSAAKGARFAALAAGFSLLFLSPWIALHAPHYWIAFTGPAVLPDFGHGPPDPVTPFTIAPLVYGSTAAQYTVTAIVVLIAGLTALRRPADTLAASMTAAAAITGVLAYAVTFFVFGPLLSGYAESVRYAVPFFIGIVPAVCALLAAQSSRQARARAVSAIFALMPVVIFAPSALARVEAALDGGVRPAFAFARSDAYAALDRQAMSGEMREQVEMLQAMVPAGASLTVWMGAPCFLDLHRNPVTEIDSAGLATPWAQLGHADYVLWEYGGYARPLVPKGDVVHSIVVGKHGPFPTKWRIGRSTGPSFTRTPASRFSCRRPTTTLERLRSGAYLRHPVQKTVG